MKKPEKNNPLLKHKKIIGIIILLFIYSVIITGSTYAFMSFSANSTAATGTGGCFQVSYTGQEITGGDFLSTDNYLEGAKSSVTLSKDNTCKIYSMANIYLHTNNATTAPIDTIPALKYKVLDGDTLIAEGTITEKNNDKLLKTVPLTNDPINYSIYFYVDSSLSDGLYHETSYSGYVYAEADQTSTIEDYLVRDLSYNANNAMSYGSTIDYDEGTLTTDGTNDYVNVGLDNYDFGNSISMVVRAKIPTIPATKNTMILGNWESGGGGIYISSGSSAPKAELYISGYKTLTSNTNITANTWYTFVYTYNGSRQALYLNGTEVASGTPTGNIKAVDIPFHLASNPTSSKTASNYSNITYSDVLIFDRALTTDEISSTYSDASKKIDEARVDKTDLLAYYNFKNEGSSSSNSDANSVLTALQSKASTANDGVYYFDSNGNLDYGNGTKINLSLTSDIPKGVVSYSNHTLVYTCMNYGSNNYEYDLTTHALSNRSMRCLTDRNQNLVINGDLSYGSNLNLTAFGTYNSDGYISIATKSTVMTTDFIPIDPTKTYEVGLDMKSSNTTVTYYAGIAEYGAKKELISASNVMYLANTLTTLTQPLNTGGTVAYFTSLANWKNNTGTASHQRGLIFWNYTDATGYTYPELTYSQNAKTNIYSDSDVHKDTNTIYIPNGWKGPNIPAGTKVSQTNSAGYNYGILSNKTITTSWTSYNNTISGINTAASVSNTKFRAGTKYIKLLVLTNYNNTSNTTTYYRNFYIREVT